MGRRNNRARHNFSFNNNQEEQHKRDRDNQAPSYKTPPTRTHQEPKQYKQPKAYTPPSRQSGNLVRVPYGQKVKANKNQTPRVIHPTPDGARQSTQPRSQQQPRAQLPNLDDINQQFQDNNRVRQVDYNDFYGTTEAVSNPIKDRLKRSKLRKKKGAGLLDTVDNSSGNSVLDSYRNLGRKLTR